MAVLTQPVVKADGFFNYKLFQQFKGLNREDSVENILDVEADDLFNTISYPRGSIRKRKGTLKVHSTALNSGAALTGGREVEFKNGTVVDVYSSKTVLYSKSGSTFTPITGAVSLTDSQDNLMSSQVFLNVLYMAFRSGDGLVKWTGSGNASAVTTPNNDAIILAKFKNRLWVVEDTEPNLLYPSDSNAETFTAGNAVNLDTDDGDKVRAMHPHLDELVAFKERSIWKLTHTRTVPAFAPREIAAGQGIGCVSHQSVVAVENFRNEGSPALLFRGRSNYYALVGDTPIPIGDKILPLLREFNRERAQYVSAGIDKDLKLVYFNESTGGSPTHNRCLAYDWEDDAWFLLDYAFNGFVQKVVSGVPQTWGLQYNGFIVQTHIGESDAALEDQTYETGGGDQALGSNAATNDYLAQSFQPSVSDDLARVQVKLKIGAGSPTGKIYCHIYSDDGAGQPDTKLATATNDLDVDTKLTSAYTFFEFLFDSLALTSGTTYHIVLNFDTPSASNYVAWEVDTSGSYANGSLNYSGDASSWTEVSGSDLSFKTFMGSEAITAYRITARLDIGEANMDKQFLRMLIIAESLGNWDVDLYMRKDFLSDWAQLDSINTGSGATIGGTWVLGTSKLGNFVAVEAFIDLSIVGKRIQFKIQNNNANEPFNIFAMNIYFDRVGTWAPSS